jgi:hypothetical protein
MRDDEVITAANEHGMAMVFTGMRHFRHWIYCFWNAQTTKLTLKIKSYLVEEISA